MRGDRRRRRERPARPKRPRASRWRSRPSRTLGERTAVAVDSFALEPVTWSTDRRRQRRRGRRARHLPRRARGPARAAPRRRRADRAHATPRRGELMDEQITFLPWLRRGLAQALTDDRPAERPARRAAPRSPRTSTSSDAVATRPVRLHGPDQVTGARRRPGPALRAAARQRRRRAQLLPATSSSPRPTCPGSTRPPRPTAQGRLRPWLVLVVVREQEGVELQLRDRRACPSCGSTRRAGRRAARPGRLVGVGARPVAGRCRRRRGRRRPPAPGRSSRGSSARAGCRPTPAGWPAWSRPSTAAPARGLGEPVPDGADWSRRWSGDRGRPAARLPPLALHHRRRRATSRRSPAA